MVIFLIVVYVVSFNALSRILGDKINKNLQCKTITDMTGIIYNIIVSEYNALTSLNMYMYSVKLCNFKLHLSSKSKICNSKMRGIIWPAKNPWQKKFTSKNSWCPEFHKFSNLVFTKCKVF